MPNVGPIEMIVVILILLVLFGPKRIPELGRSVGQGMRNFKQSVTGREHDDKPRELSAQGEGPEGLGASTTSSAVAAGRSRRPGT